MKTEEKLAKYFKIRGKIALIFFMLGPCVFDKQEYRKYRKIPDKKWHPVEKWMTGN